MLRYELVAVEGQTVLRKSSGNCDERMKIVLNGT